MKTLHRDALDSISHVEVDGRLHELGLVKILTAHPDLAEFLPRMNRVAISWVRLEGGQELAGHRHLEPSLILITEGEGKVFGDLERPLKAGDAVLVPSERLHGFRGVGRGFWALSIQFHGAALYECPAAPRVRFEIHRSAAQRDEIFTLPNLLALNAELAEAYGRSDLLRLIEGKGICDGGVREGLLDGLQVWSDHFQRLLAFRLAYSEQEAHRRVALMHLKDEEGHNHELRSQRGGRPAKVLDPPFYAAADWFKVLMISGSDIEKTAVMHLVLERSGQIFHERAARVFPNMAHFQDHGDHDVAHVELGISLLEGLSVPELQALGSTLEEGWRMMTRLCDRMAHLAENEAGSQVPG
jgi:mannose-6-phosphate isomerase-like protein (cupin superfamily)